MAAGLTERNSQRIEGFIRDVDADARSTRHSLERHIDAENRRVQMLEQELAALRESQ